MDKAWWDKTYGGIEQYLAMPLHQEIVSWLAAHYDVIDKSVLDVGGGPGLHAALLQEQYFAEVYNIDASQYATSILSHRVKSFCLDITKPPWDSLEVVAEAGAFDFLYSIQTLEHVHECDLDKVFWEMARWLRPGGYCFLSVATVDNTKDDTHVSLFPLRRWYEIAICQNFEHDVNRERVAMRSGLPATLGWQCLYLRKDLYG